MTLAKIVLGCALLLVVMYLTILRNDSSATQQAQSVSTVAVTATPAHGVTLGPVETIPLLTAYQKATASGGYLAVSAAVEQLKIYDKVPPGSTLKLTFPRAGVKQISSTFLAVGEATDPDGRTWYHIRLPIRPNGSTGWVLASDVTPVPLTHDIRIDLSEHRLDLYELGQKKTSYPVAVGKQATQTEAGDYYVTLKAKPVKTRNVYGDVIMMISAFSEALPDWPNGGQEGIHGTFETASIGKDASHGCVRLRNEDILQLTQSVPIGTPVFVRD